MEAGVYILYSGHLNRHYIGSTARTVSERLQQNNEHSFEGAFSATATDWQVVYCLKCTSLSQARRIALHIKAMKSVDYINNLIRFPEMPEKLWSRYPG